MSGALFRDRLQAILAVGAAIALPGYYDMVFRYGEPFATPRLFAEAFVLFALGFLIRSRTGWAFLMLAAAVPLHPLIALTGMAFSVIYLAVQRPLWWVVPGAGIVLAVILALSGIPPFANLQVSFDRAWLDIVKLRDPLCFVTQWSLETYCRTLLAIALGTLAFVTGEKQSRRALATALAAGLGGILCTLIGSDFAHNVFVAQLQPWRAMWLLALLANLHLVTALRRLGREPARLDVARLGVVNAAIPFVLSEFVPQFIQIAAPLMAISAGIGVWQLRTGWRLPAAIRAGALLTFALGGAATIVFCYGFKVLLEAWPDQFRSRIGACLLLVAALACMFALFRCRRRTGWYSRAVLPVTAILFGLSLYGWDARDAWARFVETPEPASASLAALLPAGATVYWEGGTRLLWLRLRRPSYFSCSQGAGVVYFRDTAVEFERRAQSFRLLRTLDFGGATRCPQFDSTAGHGRSRSDLRQVCRREPTLDYLVLAWPVEGVDGKTWVAPVALARPRELAGRLVPFRTDRFYIYACADLR
ncbi:MAG TPA: hypothetical protein VFX06_18060 [Stellaceae bacterium]|nr:hypothetical protein [Stellaceae bacterium]